LINTPRTNAFCFELRPRDADWIERNMSILQKMGIGIEGFGPNTFKIDSLPAFLDSPDPVQFMQRVIDDLKSSAELEKKFGRKV